MTLPLRLWFVLLYVLVVVDMNVVACFIVAEGALSSDGVAAPFPSDFKSDGPVTGEGTYVLWKKTKKTKQQRRLSIDDDDDDDHSFIGLN